MDETKYFELGKWHAELLFLYGKYKDLRSFCLDEDAIYSHATENKVLKGFENGEFFETTDKDRLEKWVELRTEIIHGAFKAFEMQIPVIFSSYLEDAIVSFFECYFLNSPNKIGDYVNPIDQENLKGYVRVSDIVSYKSVEQLVSDLASKAAHNAASGKSKKKVFGRLENLVGYKINADVKQKIFEIYDLRNEIVHENSRQVLGLELIDGMFDSCISMIRELGKICKLKKVPFSDPSDLL